jgi:hypothetical protein
VGREGGGASAGTREEKATVESSLGCKRRAMLTDARVITQPTAAHAAQLDPEPLTDAELIDGARSVIGSAGWLQGDAEWEQPLTPRFLMAFLSSFLDLATEEALRMRQEAHNDH